jgi:uroporphyrin-III C-methyltransferase
MAPTEPLPEHPLPRQAPGKVYLVGAGPGDPELLTLKAARLISQADAILYDQLLNPEVLRGSRADAELHFVGKKKGDHTLAQSEINELLHEVAKTHRVVVRLKGGDPLTFGRGGEEYEHLVRRGVDCEIVPGITSAVASSACFGLPLTHRDHASSVTFATGHASQDEAPESFAGFELKDRTLVVYMGLSALDRIMAELRALPGNQGAPAAVIQKVSRPRQRILYGTIETLADLAREAKVESPALIVVGDVVRFARELAEVREQAAAAAGREPPREP